MKKSFIVPVIGKKLNMKIKKIRFIPSHEMTVPYSSAKHLGTEVKTTIIARKLSNRSNCRVFGYSLISTTKKPSVQKSRSPYPTQKGLKKIPLTNVSKHTIVK